MHKLGISVYPDLRPLDEIRDYFKMCSKYGVSRVFSSMFNIEGTREEVLAYFKDLIKEAHKYGMEVSLDVNTEFLDRIGVKPDDLSVFKEIGCDIIRMDGAYGDERDIIMINNPLGIKVEFNTSMIENHIKDLIEQGADPKKMVTCHNFYPQPYTGLEWEKFKRINRNIKNISDVDIAAFVSSNAPDTRGVWDAEYGLPTVERMRHYPIDLQARLLLATDNVDDILVGNAYASEEEMADLAKAVAEKELDGTDLSFMSQFVNEKQLKNPKKIKIRVDESATDLDRKVLFETFPLVDLGDSSEWIWRARLPRVIYKNESFAPRPSGKKTFQRGDIVIVNDNYRHYAGEVQVVLIPMEDDGLRNLVGHIEGAELDMLELIQDGDVIEFMEA